MQKGGTGLKQYTTTECGGCYQYQLWDGKIVYIAYDIEIYGEIIDGAFNILLLFWQSLVFLSPALLVSKTVAALKLLS